MYFSDDTYSTAVYYHSGDSSTMPVDSDYWISTAASETHKDAFLINHQESIDGPQNLQLIIAYQSFVQVHYYTTVENYVLDSIASSSSGAIIPFMMT
jgi:hypothetical protein